jgi:hypothetical protein
MGRALIIGVLAAALAAQVAAAEPETDMTRQAALAGRFEPFDKVAGEEWAPAFPTPFYRKAPANGPEPVTLALGPGAYMVVVLCQCESMDVSLIGPGGTKVEPVRHSDQAAMYSLDVTVAGDYLTGVDMGECGEKQCDLAVKVYKKKV